MLLSEIIGKSLYASNVYKGSCTAVGISLKTGACKYVFCASKPQGDTDFAISFSCVNMANEHTLSLSSCRPILVKTHARIYPGLPVFSFDGKHLGNIQDAEISHGMLISLQTNTGYIFPFTTVSAISDAVILQKEKPYPIGQRIPAPILTQLKIKNGPLVTRSVLQSAIKNQSLIQLTLSLPPFSLQLE